MNDTTDWFDVERVASGVHQVTEGRGVLPCNTFLVGDEDAEEALLVDTALGIGDLHAVAEDLVGTNIEVLLTHSHWDHIGAAHQFNDIVIDDRERGDDGHVAIDTLSDEFVERPEQFVASWREEDKEFPEGFDPDAYDIDSATNVGTVGPGDELHVGDHTLELVAAPGHSPGQLAAIDADHSICYGADVVGIEKNVYAHFRDCDLEAYRETVATLIDYRDEEVFDIFCSGHNDPFRGDDLVILDRVHDALDRILSGNADFKKIDTDWGPAHKYDFGEFFVLTRAA